MKKEPLQRDPSQMGSLVLAYMGDAVLEMKIRQHLIACGVGKPHELQKKAVSYVSAKAQAFIVKSLWDQLDEEEQRIIKRGRNTRSHTMPKNASVSDYRLSTGFEALLGYLYLSGQQDRLEEILNQAVHAIETHQENKERGDNRE
jgi:ribonuclease-3 family protein